MAKLMKGIVSPQRFVPEGIPRPDYVPSGQPQTRRSASTVLRGAQLDALRETCSIARSVLEITKAAVKPGVTTDELDAIAHEQIIASGAYPSPLGYAGFPKSICTSVNEVICHGIPDDRPLEDGDIVNVDVTVYYNGMHGDLSETVFVGDVSPQRRRLVEVTYECLMKGIEAVKPNALVRDIGKAIEPYAKKNGLSVVRAYCGHGIGEVFHTDLMVPHHYDKHLRMRLKPGMVFTIEPMINAGTWQHKVWDDGWTAVTADGKDSAQFEHTIVVTDKGAEILTLQEGEPQPFA